jgi:hypothetical protein
MLRNIPVFDCEAEVQAFLKIFQIKPNEMLIHAMLHPTVLERMGVKYNDIPSFLTRGEFPAVDITTARQLAFGVSPRELSEGILTKKEAHLWLKQGGHEHLRYDEDYDPDDDRELEEDLDMDYALEPPNLWLANHHSVPPHRSTKVVRWFIYLRLSKKYSALGTRRFNGISLSDILDEIQEEDIVTGWDSVQKVFDRVNERNLESLLKCSKEPLRGNLPSWVNESPRIRLLNTEADLAKEGLEMKHCVGGYDRAVTRGEILIFSITTNQGRSTAEIQETSRGITVRQHKGKRNDFPPPRNEVILQAFVNRIRRTDIASVERRFEAEDQARMYQRELERIRNNPAHIRACDQYEREWEERARIRREAIERVDPERIARIVAQGFRPNNPRGD